MSFLGDLVPYFQSSDGEEDSDASATVTNRYGTDDQEDTRVRVPRVRIKKQREKELEEEEEVDQEEVVRSKKIPLQIRRFGLPDEGHRVRLVVW